MDKPERQNYRRIEVRPIAGALGAEIRGVDIARPLEAEVVSEIRRAFLDHVPVLHDESHVLEDADVRRHCGYRAQGHLWVTPIDPGTQKDPVPIKPAAAREKPFVLPRSSPYIFNVASLSFEKSKVSGASFCMPYAVSNDLMRAASIGSALPRRTSIVSRGRSEARDVWALEDVSFAVAAL
jgi:hypothetical protein